jgi:riboflavin kinase/FMN adenylyltransferase
MLIKYPHDLPAALQSPVVVIGNFDGVHLGHRLLLDQAKNIAANLNAPVIVLSFEPHPKMFFMPKAEPFRIAPLPVKHRKLVEAGAQALYIMNFDQALSQMNAQDFVQQILQDKLGASHVVIGEGFAFGHKRGGHAQTILDAGIDVTEVPPLTDDQDIISSSRIRHAIRDGDLEAAKALLGWPWEVEGEVVHGDKRGRELGYPTANVPLGQTLWPSYGVYAVRVSLPYDPRFEGQVFGAAANIGVRPMFQLEQPQLEAFIFDFDADIYGQILRVQPIEKLRDEAKFDSLDALMDQMEQDCIKARQLLGDTSS